MTLIDQAVLELVQMNKTFAEIRSVMGLSYDALANRLKRLRAGGHAVPDMRANTGTLKTSLGHYSDGVEVDPRAASIRHLIDFKKAGHTAAEYIAKHELRGLETERPSVVRFYPAHGSLCGSPSAWCMNS